MSKREPVERFKLVNAGGKWRFEPLSAPSLPLLERLCGEPPAKWLEHTAAEMPLHWLVGQLLVLANQRGLVLQPTGLLQDPVLVLQARPLQRQQPGVLYPFAQLHGRYAAHWGLTDLYPENAAALKTALESGQPFDTQEFGAKKEIQYGRVSRKASGEIHVHVRCEADDGVALADTAFWKAAGGNSGGDSGLDALMRRGLPQEEAVRQIHELALASAIGETNEVSAQAELPSSASYEMVLEALSRLCDEADQVLNARSDQLQSLAQARWAALPR